MFPAKLKKKSTHKLFIVTQLCLNLEICQLRLVTRDLRGASTEKNQTVRQTGWARRLHAMTNFTVMKCAICREELHIPVYDHPMQGNFTRYIRVRTFDRQHGYIPSAERTEGYQDTPDPYARDPHGHTVL